VNGFSLGNLAGIIGGFEGTPASLSGFGFGFGFGASTY